MLMKPRTRLLNIESDSDSSDGNVQQTQSRIKISATDEEKQNSQKSVFKGLDHQRVTQKSNSKLKDRYQSNKIAKNFMYQANQQEKQFGVYQIRDIPQSQKSIAASNFQRNLQLEIRQSQNESQTIDIKVSCLKSKIIGKIRLDSSDSQSQISKIQNRQPSVQTPISLDIINDRGNIDISFLQHEAKRQNKQSEMQNAQQSSEEATSTKLISLKSADIKCWRQFSTQYLPKNNTLRLTLKRDKSGLNHFWPEYDVIYSEDCKHCLSFKRLAGNATANYTISLDKSNFDKGPHILGKVRSNFAGSVFNVFTNGANPTKATSLQKTRGLLATIVFYKSDLLQSGPRQFKVFTLRHPYNYWDLDGVKLLSEQYPLDKLYEIPSNHDKIEIFTNRKPIWNKDIAGYIMDFGGRIDKPSVKNFILNSDNKKQVLMFGRLGQDLFSFEISPPLLPLVAVGVVIANFESKVVCQ